MPTFPKYESYKNSGVAWLEDIPEHWEVLPGRAYLKPKKVKNTGNKVDTVLSLSYGKIVIKPEEKLHGLVPESFETFQIADPGDFIVRATDLQNDHTSLRIGLVGDRGIITSAYLCLHPTEMMNSRFAYYLLHSYDLLKVYYGMGSGLRQNLDYTDFKYLPLTVPSLEEQKRIVEFLDRTTTEIDRAISQKQRLIELLQEQKAILINQAVTKGLNPNVPMRDSGIEWIGEIPEHWEVWKIAHASKKVTNGYVGPTRDILTDAGVRYIQSLHVKEQTIKFLKPYYVLKKWSEAHSRSILQKHDVLIVQTGGCVGEIALVPEEFSGCNCHALIIISPKENLVFGAYLAKYLSSTSGRQNLQSIETGALHPHLNSTIVKDMLIPVPPLEEQKLIIKRLNDIDVLFQETRDSMDREIETIKEFRQTLISHAVTGKIKV